MIDNLPATPDIATLRSHFPALNGDTILLENAGGSQVPLCVPEAMKRYMLETYVQLGAPYTMSESATQIVADAHAFAETCVNGSKTGKAIIGPSTSQLCAMLADCYGKALKPGDEIVIAETAHEANAGPWARLAEKGFKVLIWKIDPATYQCSLGSLEDLLTENTKIVAFPHVSNLLGEIVDVKEITRIAHRAGAKVVADGVAYAPHRAIDVQEWDVDFYVYSVYKVFGPHMAVLFAKNGALQELEGPNHFFLPKNDAYKFELGGPSHEACAGFLASQEYFQALARQHKSLSHETVSRAYEVITELELPLQQRLVEYLLTKKEVKIIGPASAGTDRVPTISFTHRKSSQEIAMELCRHKIAVRAGHMYAYRMCEALGIDVNDGVVRISAVHYNTLEEIDRLIEVLEEIL